jgi:hypothetical protein
MKQIKILAELHWAVARPELAFKLNNQLLIHKLYILDRINFTDRVEFLLSVDNYESLNTLEITLLNKIPELCTDQSDHWVDIKDVLIDNISSDWLLHKNSVFRHSMSKECVDSMATQGYIIESEYQPGTHLRLNGTCFYKFKWPFFIYKLLTSWKK